MAPIYYSMEGDSNTIVRDASQKMDEMIQSVMPDTWIGHARLILAQRDISESKEEKVLKHTENIVENKGLPADKTAEKVLEKLGE